MKKVKTLFLIVFTAVFMLLACNLPVIQGAKEPTATIPMVSVSQATEYRTGPGPAYSLVGVLNPGQEVEVVGRNPDGGYWLIREPANPTSLVWLKNDFAKLTGNPIDLPVSTPPPTPALVATLPATGGCPTPVGGGPNSGQLLRNRRHSSGRQWLSNSNRRRPHPSQLFRHRQHSSGRQ